MCPVDEGWKLLEDAILKQAANKSTSWCTNVKTEHWTGEQKNYLSRWVRSKLHSKITLFHWDKLNWGWDRNDYAWKPYIVTIGGLESVVVYVYCCWYWLCAGVQSSQRPGWPLASLLSEATTVLLKISKRWVNYILIHPLNWSNPKLSGIWQDSVSF